MREPANQDMTRDLFKFKKNVQGVVFNLGNLKIKTQKLVFLTIFFHGFIFLNHKQTNLHTHKSFFGFECGVLMHEPNEQI